MGRYKNQLTGKYERKVSVSDIFLTLNSLFTLENLPLLTYWVTFPISKYESKLACIKFQLNLWQNINEELFKVEYLIKLSQYFRNLAEAVMRLYSKTFFSKAFKLLADFNKLFNFEKFLIYVLPEI